MNYIFFSKKCFLSLIHDNSVLISKEYFVKSYEEFIEYLLQSILLI